MVNDGFSQKSNKPKMDKSRRRFLKNAFAGSVAVSFGGILPGFSASSYNNIIGANEKLRAAIMGVNSRGLALGTNFAAQNNCEVIYVSDVDTRAMDKFVAEVEKIQNRAPKKQTDFRKALKDKDVDFLVIATPDHWHTPAAILALKAGKHVYVEKPCSHNPHEGEMLIKASEKYKKVIQVGNQRRSWPNVAAAIAEVKNDAIGRPYYAKTWYTNNRGSIGEGKITTVPDWLNYDLWQGPAPRKTFKDNLIHYNWHWFWHWGTGESGNNGIHMVDLARWGLGVDFPINVSSSGGRYRYKDDWETPDTQIINLEFENKMMISWEGRSCNGSKLYGASTGVMFYGENGSLLIPEGNAYTVFDLQGKIIKEVQHTQTVEARNTSNPSQWLDAFHLQNFFDAIKKGDLPNSNIKDGHKSTLLVQLGNIAHRSNSSLQINAENGHIKNEVAAKYWKRKYAPGWEPTLY